jgi:hypothetical protein
MMKYSDTPMGKSFEIAIMVGSGNGHEMKENGEEENGEEENGEEGYSKKLAHNPKVKLAPAEAKYVESMYEIVAEYGKLADNDGNGIWVGYVPASQNKDAAIGVKCRKLQLLVHSNERVPHYCGKGRRKWLLQIGCDRGTDWSAGENNGTQK